MKTIQINDEVREVTDDEFYTLTGTTPPSPQQQIVLLDQYKTAKIAELANQRYVKETLGIFLNGSPIDTDRVSQAMISGAYSFAQATPNDVIWFKGRNGWVELTSQQMQGIALCVGRYVQLCFKKEKEFTDLIWDAPDFTTFFAIDTSSGWPDNHFEIQIGG